MLSILLFAILTTTLCGAEEGFLTTLAGSSFGLSDGIGSNVAFRHPMWLALSHDGTSLYITDRNNHIIRSYVINTGQVLHLAGKENIWGFADGVGPHARFRDPTILCMHPFQDYLLVVDTFNDRIRTVNVTSARVTTVAGNGLRASIDGYGTHASLSIPHGLAIDPTGSYALIADIEGHRLRRLDLVTFALITIAGSGNAGFTLGSGPYVNIRNPSYITISPDGAFALFVDAQHVIYMLDMHTNVVSLFCGTPGVIGSRTGPCSTATFYYPGAIAFSKDMSTLYVSDQYNHRIVSIDMASRYVYHIVGNGPGTVDGPPSIAKMSIPLGIMLTPDESGLFIADYEGGKLRFFKFSGQQPTQAPSLSPYDTTGLVTSFAGTTFMGYQDDTTDFAVFNSPHKMVITLNGKTALVCDTMNHVIRGVDVSLKEVYRFAGSRVAGFANGIGTTAQFNQPTHIVLHPTQNRAFITDRYNHLIRELNIVTRDVSTIVGSGIVGHLDAVGTSATLNFPTGIAIDHGGNYLLFTETGSHLLRKVDLVTKLVTRIAGQVVPGFATGVGTVASFNSPWGVAIASSGKFALVADSINNMVRKVMLENGEVSNYCGWLYAGRTTGKCDVARFSYPLDVVIARDDSFAVVADRGNVRLCWIDMDTRRVMVLAGTGVGGSDDGPRLTATLNSVTGVTIHGNLVYFADASSHKLRAVDMPLLSIPTSHPSRAPTATPTLTKYPTPSPTRSPIRAPTAGTTLTLAGSGAPSSIDGVGFGATMKKPFGIAYLPDKQHAIFSNNDDHTLRIVNVHSGKVVTIAGSGAIGHVNGFGTSVRFYYPEGIAVHPTDDYALICDNHNHVIRHVNLTNYKVSTFAGKGDIAVRDDIGTNAGFSYPGGIAIHPLGRYALITDRIGNTVRRLHLFHLTVSTIAGSGAKSYVDGTGRFASFNAPQGVAISPDGTYALVADILNNVIRLLHLSTLQVSTYCGTSTLGSANGHCTTATFDRPEDVKISENGKLIYVADGNVIRVINETSYVRVLSGTGVQGNTDGVSTSAKHNRALGIALQGSILLASDSANNQIRIVDMTAPMTPTIAPSPFPTTSPTAVPSPMPTMPLPTAKPTHVPTIPPTCEPTLVPTSPTAHPSERPSHIPTPFPSYVPTQHPTNMPTPQPTVAPSDTPTVAPTTSNPTYSPTLQPSVNPTHNLTSAPSTSPSLHPTASPSHLPSCAPRSSPTRVPTAPPSFTPTSKFPTLSPTTHPTVLPTRAPTSVPSSTTHRPTELPSVHPSLFPTHFPTVHSTLQPSLRGSTMHPTPLMQCPAVPHFSLNVSLFAGKPAVGGSSNEESFVEPTGIIVALDSSYILVVSAFSHTIRKVATALRGISQYAGTPGVSGYRNGVGADALFAHPTQGAIHPTDDYILLVDSANHVIRRITVYFREVSLFCGSGENAVSDGIGVEASFSQPFGIAISPDGRQAIVTEIIGLRIIDLESLAVTTFYAPSETLVRPLALSFVPHGSTVLIADHAAHAIFAYDIAKHKISLVCGQRGAAGYSNGACSKVKMRNPTSVRISPNGTQAIVSVGGNHVVQEIDLVTMCIRTVAGTGVAGYLNGPAVKAKFSFPTDSAYMKDGGIVVLDRDNGVVRVLYEMTSDGTSGNQLDNDPNTNITTNALFWYAVTTASLLLIIIIAGSAIYVYYQSKKNTTNESTKHENDQL